MFCLISNRCGISQSTLFWGLTYSLAHCLVIWSNTICNNPNPPLTNIVRFGLLYIAANRHGFKNAFTRKRCSHPYKECFVPLSNRCGISQFTFFGGLAFSLAHRSISGFDTICNSPNPPLVDIVRFSPLRIAVSLTVLKHVD